MKPAGGWTAGRLLEALRGAGARRLERVRFRWNRRRIWSLTAGGAALNLHEGYRDAPWSCLRHFATIADRPDRGDPGARAAMAAVAGWPGLAPALARARGRERGRSRPGFAPCAPGPCCGTPSELGRLRALYGRLNRRRFQGVLPSDLHLRLSSRMRSRLGHMRGHESDGRRYVIEIALRADLMLDANRGQRIDTLLHEMAHAADWLLTGGRGHGPTWKAWARRVGCEPRACTRMGPPFRSRARGRERRAP